MIALGGKNVTAIEEIVREISNLEACMTQLVNMDDALDGHRKEVINIRRQFTNSFSKIAVIAVDVFTTPASLDLFRRKHSEARSAIAEPQSKWPIVTLDMADPKCIASVRSSREATRAFLRWVKNTVA